MKILLVLIDLRPNLQRLHNGTERFVGWRPWKGGKYGERKM
jgi:hypothetical protein